MDLEKSIDSNEFFKRNQKIIEMIDLLFDPSILTINATHYEKTLKRLAGNSNQLRKSLDYADFDSVGHEISKNYFNLKEFEKFLEDFEKENREIGLFQKIKTFLLENPNSDYAY